MKIKTKEEAFAKLKELRQIAKDAHSEISYINSIIEKKGWEDDVKMKRDRRNAEMYRLWKAGKKFVELAAMFEVSVTTASNVCSRLERRS
ncbi:hypothetical protein LZZ85_11335 [Terrimonas sp. NA20]|uniref:Chromosomal replication initiator DnaA C-terminal domain-containing protein n=1 Tax=Terrimonas ginsenosidimutans TaxID=2908004 RepID=A0ABS9KRE2_9BACT|nr:hypothetical protein [Terrimonas ginsenosidimutans]MCG2614881.1 hypothetical protein [Terrimonas ginsenosidimutans]